MKRITQTSDELFANLSSVDTNWRDATADQIILFLDKIPQGQISKADLIVLLDKDFDTTISVFRLFLEQSKDEFVQTMREQFLGKKAGKTGYKEDRQGFVDIICSLGLLNKINEVLSAQYTWKDILIERLKAGRGSAIKGQSRGRSTENFVEEIVKNIFGKYDVRCSFIGKDGLSKEKADFAIPNKETPFIIIEVKAYGATGSKQTDVIGDITRIIQEKRSDTFFLLFTDGLTWKQRANDFKKLVKFQNEGSIYRIYTKKMSSELIADLEQLKRELGL